MRSLIECPALVITATASRAARKKIKKRLAMIRSTDIVENPDRPNIKLFVQKVKSSALLSSTFSWLIEAVRLEKQQTGRVLVFCPSIKLCGELYTLFRMELDKLTLSHVDMYHSCTTENVKEKIRNDMEQSNGNIRILIATSAAGMGVNYKSVNQIVGEKNDRRTMACDDDEIITRN